MLYSRANYLRQQLNTVLDLANGACIVQNFHGDDTILRDQQPLVNQKLDLSEIYWLHWSGKLGVAKAHLRDALYEWGLPSFEAEEGTSLAARTRLLTFRAPTRCFTTS
jgi:hypothetical protein